MAKTAHRFKYQGRSKEDIKERANARGGGFDSIILPKFKRYKMRDGKNILRVLPPTWKGARHYGYDIWINYGIGVDNQSYLSLSKMKSEADPVAEARASANRKGDEEVAKQLQPRQRVLMWVIDRQAEDEGPQLFDAPMKVDKALANLSIDDDTKEVLQIDDPEEGNDFRFYKEGSGLKTDYDASKMKLLKPSPLCQDEALQEEWLDYVQANPITVCLQYYDYDHIQGVLEGQVKKGAADDDDEEEKPARRTRPASRTVEDEDGPEEKPTARRARPEPEPDPEDEEEADPAPRSRRARPEPEPDPDDEEEETPPLHSKKRAAPEPEEESINTRLKRRRAVAADDDE